MLRPKTRQLQSLAEHICKMFAECTMFRSAAKKVGKIDAQAQTGQLHISTEWNAQCSQRSLGCRVRGMHNKCKVDTIENRTRWKRSIK